MLHTQSTLQELLESVIEIVNKAENPVMESGTSAGINEWQLFQKFDELRNAIEASNANSSTLASHIGTIAEALTKILEGDDERLMERLKAKVKANYSEQKDVLIRFVQWMDEKSGEQFPSEPGAMVENFLEEVGDT